jgi:hypothetical protein
MGRKEEFAKDLKACPQCGSSMEKIEFTPKKVTSASRRGTKPGYNLNKKATGPKQTYWQCMEDFGHTVNE